MTQTKIDNVAVEKIFIMLITMGLTLHQMMASSSFFKDNAFFF